MKYRSIVCTIILVMVLSITVGFSAFVSEMSISKIVADVRVEKDVRITDVSFVDGYYTGDIPIIEYDADSIIVSKNFTSQDDFVTLDVTITNFGSSNVGIFDMVTPNGIGFWFDDYNMCDKICDDYGKCNLGSVQTYRMNVYVDGLNYVNSDRHQLDFTFKDILNISYINIPMNDHYFTELGYGETLDVLFENDIPDFVILYSNGVKIPPSEYFYEDGYLMYKYITTDMTIEGVYDSEYIYGYTGNSQEFIAPVSGIYRVELWGASGVYKSDVHDETVGKGGYVAGNISLKKNDKFYIYVGPNNGSQFNGAGHGEAPGGGATDVRLVSGSWDDFESLKSRIIVAGAGGGGVIKSYSTTTYTYEGNSPGHGGGLNGYDASFSPSGVGYSFSGHGATQTAGGSPGAYSGIYDITDETYGKFGKGGYKIYNNVFSASGGGGGYYGGGHGVHPGSSWPGAGGGSSFISGHNGCNAIDELSVSENIIHTNQSVHYSGYVFTDTLMIDGAGYQWTTSKGTYAGMPSWDGTSTMSGNAASGYAKITLLQLS